MIMSWVDSFKYTLSIEAVQTCPKGHHKILETHMQSKLWLDPKLAWHNSKCGQIIQKPVDLVLKHIVNMGRRWQNVLIVELLPQ